METIFRKVLVEHRLPKNERITYFTNSGICTHTHGQWNSIEDVKWWLEEIKLPTEEEISNEAEKLNAGKDENGRTIFKYAFDENEQDAFINGATWLKECIIS